MLGLRLGQAHVAGIWLRQSGPESRRIAYRLAQQTASKLSSACEITTLETVGPSGEAALQAGLRARQTIPVCVLNKSRTLAFPTNFQFQMLDRDAWFLDTTETNYWT